MCKIDFSKLPSKCEEGTSKKIKCRMENGKFYQEDQLVGDVIIQTSKFIDVQKSDGTNEVIRYHFN